MTSLSLQPNENLYTVHVLIIYTIVYIYFYRAMHFSAKRSIAIVYCPSVCDF